MYFTIRNTSDQTVVDGNPWEFDVSGVDFNMEKSRYKAVYYNNSRANHCMFSLCEGVMPNMRIDGRQDGNECAAIHGFVGDFDGVSDESLLNTLSANPPSEYPPTRYSITQSGKIRLIWEFNRAVSVLSTAHAVALLKEIAKRVKAKKWGSDLDDKAPFAPTQFFDVGRKWGVFGEGKQLDSSLVEMWDRKVMDPFVDQRVKSKFEIPWDAIRQAIEEKFPGKVRGAIEPGARCVRFWDPDADNPTGAMLTEKGCRVFTPHDNGFKSWAGIFGQEWADQYEAERTSPYLRELWFNSAKGSFMEWSDVLGCYAEITREDLRAKLSSIGFRKTKARGQDQSDVDTLISKHRETHMVLWSAPILYRHIGPMKLSDRGVRSPRVLNTSTLVAMAPYQNLWTEDWSWGNPAIRDKFPFIYGLLSTMFEASEDLAEARIQSFRETGEFPVVDPKAPGSIQIRTFLDWLSYFYYHALTETPKPGQCLVISGPKGTGKTFILNQIVAPLMAAGSPEDGAGDASNYFCGLGKFTGDMVTKPLLLIDDKIVDMDQKKRADFTTRIKSVVATGTLRYEEKFKNALESLPYNGRVVIACNTDPRSLSVLPEFNPSTRDKFLLLKINGVKWSFNARALGDENARTVDQELKYFARFLYQREVRRIEELRAAIAAGEDVEPSRERMGVTAYYEPELLAMANEKNGTATIVQALHAVLDHYAEVPETEGKLRVQDGAGGINATADRILDTLRLIAPSLADSFRRGTTDIVFALRQLQQSGLYKVTGGDLRHRSKWHIEKDFDSAVTGYETEEE